MERLGAFYARQAPSRPLSGADRRGGGQSISRAVGRPIPRASAWRLRPRAQAPSIASARSVSHHLSPSWLFSP
jgi:hypothetical protein